KDAVIACGGGVVLNKINIDRLKGNALIIYLTASPGAILKRVSTEIGQRPLLSVPDPMLAIRELMKFRKPFYERSADIIVNTTKMDIPTVVEQILERL
ncbi:MAG: shikimate kinase, partial [Chloroflexi bacterium]|nr:shikimate kinase [Chloroflexota bacterium]